MSKILYFSSQLMGNGEIIHFTTLLIGTVIYKLDHRIEYILTQQNGSFRFTLYSYVSMILYIEYIITPGIFDPAPRPGPAFLNRGRTKKMFDNKKKCK